MCFRQFLGVAVMAYAVFSAYMCSGCSKAEWPHASKYCQRQCGFSVCLILSAVQDDVHSSGSPV